MTIDWLITRPSGVVIVLVDTTPGAGTRLGTILGTIPGTTAGMVAIGTTLGIIAGMILGTIPGTTDMAGVGAGATLAGAVVMYRPTVTLEPSDVRILTDMWA